MNDLISIKFDERIKKGRFGRKKKNQLRVEFRIKLSDFYQGY